MVITTVALIVELLPLTIAVVSPTPGFFSIYQVHRPSEKMNKVA